MGGSLFGEFPYLVVFEKENSAIRWESFTYDSVINTVQMKKKIELLP